jgi:hypothetical protein
VLGAWHAGRCHIVAQTHLNFEAWPWKQVFDTLICSLHS